jgi:hypothetical protein
VTFAVAGYTVAHGQIVEIDPLADPCSFAVRPAPVRRCLRGGVCARRPGIRDPDCVANHEMTNKDAERCNKRRSAQLGDRYGS